MQLNYFLIQETIQRTGNRAILNFRTENKIIRKKLIGLVPEKKQ